MDVRLSDAPKPQKTIEYAAGSGPPHYTKVTMDVSDSITYQPSIFRLLPGQHQLVVTKVQNTTSGLAFIYAFADDAHTLCQDTIDLGFEGHLDTAKISLTYGEAQPLTIQILDSSGKPLRGATGFKMQIQSADVSLNEKKEGEPVTVDVPTGTAFSNPVAIKSTKIKGGTVHLIASLMLGESVVAQSAFAFDVAPPWWLTCLLAILGAMLYATYDVSATS